MQIFQESIGSLKYYYTYDKLGNITQIKQSENGTETVIASYAYDELNQLVRENSLYTGRSSVYTYDNGGNIREETQYPLSFDTLGTATKTIPYGYTDANWKDKMTFYDGQPVTYDAIGNPLSYRGYVMEWQNGRQLKSMAGTGLDIAYQYDSSGMRTSKTVNGEKTEYYYVGGQLTYKKRGTDKELYYFYDSNGAILGIRYVKNGTATDYVLVTNWRGDVESIYSTAGIELARYSYDAWGKVTSIRTPNGEDITDSEHIAHVNPIRYRGYYQDTETGMYYLQSRYYDPVVHRFLNADGLVGMDLKCIRANLYEYCDNNPVMTSDTNGLLVAYRGVSVPGSFCGLGGSLSVIYAEDDKGNSGWFYSYGYGGGILSIGAGEVAGFIWDAESIDELENFGVQTGISGGYILSGGIDLVSLEKKSSPINGLQLSFGVGAGVDFHGYETYTKPISKGNNKNNKKNTPSSKSSSKTNTSKINNNKNSGTGGSKCINTNKPSFPFYPKNPVIPKFNILELKPLFTIR